jgi:hypothetical protein
VFVLGVCAEEAAGESGDGVAQDGRDVRWLPAACGSWTVHLDANALVKKGTFDLLRTTVVM